VSLLQEPLGGVQAKNWDPKVNYDGFAVFCKALGEGNAGSSVGWKTVPAVVANYAKYIKEVRLISIILSLNPGTLKKRDECVRRRLCRIVQKIRRRKR